MKASAEQRRASRKLRGTASVDGAGVSLVRIFGNAEASSMDPFLLLDHFGSNEHAEYLPGFPWHPHRGMETVTYLVEGKVEHGDSMGNRGAIAPGDAQWMTAGSGIIHQEMPRQGNAGPGMHGFQLWVNLPASHKMTEPRYRSIPASAIPKASFPGGEISVLAGEYQGLIGPTPDLIVPMVYFIVRLEPDMDFLLSIPAIYNAAAYVYQGSAAIGGLVADASELLVLPPSSRPGAGAVAGDTFDEISAHSGPGGASFLFLGGKPLGEPIAWGGPIVMNTRKELETAFREYREGTFIKSRPREAFSEL
ncbi:MAG TPA: pirin family protein [Rectinemataceae bacterium]